MEWIDNLSKRMGERAARKKVCLEEEKIPGISQDLDTLEELRLELIKMDEELELRSLEWDRAFDSNMKTD